ncbi:hypothetical protein PR202_gb25890 [Eleusine coracana subsp. coracana]|uniref:Uncharacterized protein n=1 Tax=Eleusine coracana subsp. coracana TaxID=191504 RepID=A0AAV5FQH0_ELECO|nr:hypothetical protein PR202_gb25890 [Eleusine coracana subsp. coracana]
MIQIPALGGGQSGFRWRGLPKPIEPDVQGYRPPEAAVFRRVGVAQGRPLRDQRHSPKSASSTSPRPTASLPMAMGRSASSPSVIVATWHDESVVLIDRSLRISEGGASIACRARTGLSPAGAIPAAYDAMSRVTVPTRVRSRLTGGGGWKNHNSSGARCSRPFTSGRRSRK